MAIPWGDSFAIFYKQEAAGYGLRRLMIHSKNGKPYFESSEKDHDFDRREMLDFIRQNIFAVHSMVARLLDLEKVSWLKPEYPVEVAGMKIFSKRLRELDQEYRVKIKGALRAFDFKPPFDVREAEQRLAKGYYFFILEENDRIIGWRWIAINRVFIDEFNCYLKIKDAQGFSYNKWIAKEFRNKRLNHVIDKETFYQMQEDGYKKLWGLVAKSNVASRKSGMKIGWQEIGSYKFMKLFFMNLRLPPKGWNQ